MSMKFKTLIALSVVFLFPIAAMISWNMNDWNSSEEAVIPIAVNYVKTSPTYSFDGVPESVVVKDMVVFESYPLQYGVVVEFDCLHSGYGDREGKVLLQVITNHTARIRVSKGVVVYAVLDDYWDMILQTPLEED